jgi:hypothetical protein
MKTSTSSQKAITSSRTAVSQETEGPQPGLPPTLSDSKTGLLAEHWDVLQDEATQAESVSGLPMFGNTFPS